MFSGEMVMVEVAERGIVSVSDVDNSDFRIGQIFWRRFASLNFATVNGDQHTGRQKVIFMSTTRMGDDFLKHLGSRLLGPGNGRKPSLARWKLSQCGRGMVVGHHRFLNRYPRQRYASGVGRTSWVLGHVPGTVQACKAAITRMSRLAKPSTLAFAERVR